MSRRELHKSVKTDFQVVPMPPVWGIDVLVYHDKNTRGPVGSIGKGRASVGVFVGMV